MNLKKNLIVAVLMTAVTTVLLGVVYPLLVTGLAQALFHDKANGQLRERDGHTVGSEIIAQAFAGDGYFHPRASAAGQGYDTTSSGGTNFGPTNKKLIDSVRAAVDAAHKDNPSAPVPIDMVTASASGLDPHITPDNALFQVPRVARARGINENDVRFDEPRVNVLRLNLDLDAAAYSSAKR